MRRCRGLFRLSGAFFQRQFSADYTIVMFGFDFRQGQLGDRVLTNNEGTSAESLRDFFESETLLKTRAFPRLIWSECSTISVGFFAS